MKKLFTVLIGFILSITLSGCGIPNLKTLVAKDAIEAQLGNAAKIVFTNIKENALRITVADTNGIEQIASIIGKRKQVDSVPGVDPDYSMLFYLPDGSQRKFYYWMGASENNKDVNFSDEYGQYYMVSENMDIYILNSTRMVNRPKNFAELYSLALSDSITQLPKEKKTQTTVGVDITSDRRLRRYTMSYEEEKIFSGIHADGYIVLPYAEGQKYTYTISYTTPIYNHQKAGITVEAIKTSDKTVRTFNLNYKLSGNRWQAVKEEK